MKRAYSIAAVALALSLLMGYVVYSLRQFHKPSVAPGPKAGIYNLRQIDGAKATWALEQKAVAPETVAPPESNPPPSSTPVP